MSQEQRDFIYEPSTPPPAEAPKVSTRVEFILFLVFAVLATFSAVTLVTKRAQLVSIAYEGRTVELELKRARERLKQLYVERSSLIVPQRLEGFAGRHGYRSAEAGQIVLLERTHEMR